MLDKLSSDVIVNMSEATWQHSGMKFSLYAKQDTLTFVIFRDVLLAKHFMDIYVKPHFFFFTRWYDVENVKNRV